MATRILPIVALLLLIPYSAMHVTEEVNWSLTDFIVMGTMLTMTGILILFIHKKAERPITRRLLFVSAVLFFVLIWVELAVGIFGTPFAGNWIRTNYSKTKNPANAGLLIECLGWGYTAEFHLIKSNLTFFAVPIGSVLLYHASSKFNLAFFRFILHIQSWETIFNFYNINAWRALWTFWLVLLFHMENYTKAGETKNPAG